jgi:tetratricopeptide (TPR) repeat protein
MKTTTIALTLLTLAIAGALGMYITRDHNKPAPSMASGQSETSEATRTPVPADDNPSLETEARKADSPALARATSHLPAVEAAAAKDAGAVIFDQAVRTLISPQVSFQEKQAAWSQIRAAGKFDQLIADLEQRFAAQPTAPELPATLGQAYLQKAGSIQDIREQGILGMKADQSFDAALNLDASNWEARFWKAKAMSYWPPQLGKGNEVIENCLELVRQQEVLPPQEQFAQTYVLLGEQYQAQGQPEYAAQTWKRGLGLFPSDAVLKQKLAVQK